jgi:hypothetical protein
VRETGTIGEDVFAFRVRMSFRDMPGEVLA